MAAAFLAALRFLAADRPLCLAIDDLQWLDAASLAALRFALGTARRRADRVASSPVRGERAELAPSRVAERRLPSHRDRTGSASAPCSELLRERLGTGLPAADADPALRDVRRKSVLRPRARAGAPTTRRDAAPGDPLPIPATLDELLGERLDALGTACTRGRTGGRRRSRADARRSSRPLSAPWPRRVSPRPLDARRPRAGRRSRSASRIPCSAPPSPRDRRRRPTSAPRSARRARPDAGGARATSRASRRSEPDAEIAAILEEAARAAARPRRTAAAAELAEQALRLTPPRDAADAPATAALSPPTATTSRRPRAGDRPPGAGARGGCAGRRPGDRPRSSRPNGRKPAGGDLSLSPRALAEAERRRRSIAEIHLEPRRADALRRKASSEGSSTAELAVAAGRAIRRRRAPLPCARRYGLLRFNAGHGIPQARDGGGAALERSLADWPLDDGRRRSPRAISSGGRAQSTPARELLHEVARAAGREATSLGEADALCGTSRSSSGGPGNWVEADRYATARSSSTRSSAPALRRPGIRVADRRCAPRARGSRARAGPSRRSNDRGEPRACWSRERASAGFSAHVELSLGRSSRGAPAPAARTRAARRDLRSRAGHAPRARRPRSRRSLRRRARRGRASAPRAWQERAPGARPRLGARDPRSLPGPRCSRHEGDLDGRVRELRRRRSPSTPASPTRSNTLARCSRSAARNDAPRSAAPPARRSRTPSRGSRRSARRSGPSRHVPSSPASAAAHPPAASSRRPSAGSPSSSPRDVATARWQPSSSSRSTPSRPRSAASTASSASARAESSGACCQTAEVSSFRAAAVGSDASLRGKPLQEDRTHEATDRPRRRRWRSSPRSDSGRRSSSSATGDNAVVHWSGIAEAAISAPTPPGDHAAAAGEQHRACGNRARRDLRRGRRDRRWPGAVRDHVSAPPEASVEAAVAQAARDVLVARVPAQAGASSRPTTPTWRRCRRGSRRTGAKRSAQRPRRGCSHCGRVTGSTTSSPTSSHRPARGLRADRPDVAGRREAREGAAVHVRHARLPARRARTRSRARSTRTTSPRCSCSGATRSTTRTARADRDRPVPHRPDVRPVQPRPAPAQRRARARRRGVGAAARLHLGRGRRHDDRLLGGEVPLHVLAAQPRDPAGRHHATPPTRPGCRSSPATTRSIRRATAASPPG